MTSSPQPSAATTSRAHGATFLALLCSVLWCSVVVMARDTPLAVPAMLATGASLALSLWLCRERRRLTRELHDRQATQENLAAHVALVELVLEADISQVLAHSATLLGATRAWLKVEPYAGAVDHYWSASGAVDDTQAAGATAPWWQGLFSDDDVFVSKDTAPPRAAALLRQDEVKLGVLAFEASSAQRPWDGREARLLAVLSALLRQLLLHQRLERALHEATEQGARERRMFLGNLSHKLRTPMTAVLGFAQILAFDQSLAAEHREFVREIDAAGRALLDMINDLVGVPRE
jgi:signal transduction histidine kinase